DRDRGAQCPRRLRLALDATADVEKVAGRQGELLAQAIADLRGRAAEVAARDARIDRDPTHAGLAPDRARPERLLDCGELAERYPCAVVAVDEEPAQGARIGRVMVLELQHDVVAALPDPHRCLLF